LNKRICTVTGTRAEYGILKGLMKLVEQDPDSDLQLIVTGSHLNKERGHTVDVIENDGFSIDVRVDIAEATDDPVSIARSAGRCVAGVAEALGELNPDLVVLVGDRFEAFAAAQACTILNIPLAHIHGGELTEGAFDDCLRHAITKLAHLHFVAAAPYRNRVIQMGEAPDKVFNVGAPGLDNISDDDLMGVVELEKRLNFKIGHKYFMLTYHPETRSNQNIARIGSELATALDAFPDYRVIITGVNADPGRDAVSDMLLEFVRTRPQRATMVESLGQAGYLSAVKHAAAVIGNSSSGIIEAPALNTPTVNIGDRQKGRLMARSIVNCDPTGNAIKADIEKCLDEEFVALISDQVRPYGNGGASEKILDVIKATNLSGITAKSFYDLPSQGAIL